MKMHVNFVTIFSTILICQVSCQTMRYLKIAANAKITAIYADGQPLSIGANIDRPWSQPTIIPIYGTSSLLAVKLESSVAPKAWILADSNSDCNYFSSPATVKCVPSSVVSRVTESWYKMTFIDSFWPSAYVSRAASSVLVYPPPMGPQFCRNAQWLWTATYAGVIHCRVNIAACDPMCNSGCSANGAGRCDSTCRTGYVVNNATKKCEVIVCPRLNVPNSSLNTSHAEYRTAVRVQCNDDYAIDPLDWLNNSIDTVCTSSGNWSPSPISCQRLQAGIPRLVQSITVGSDVAATALHSDALFVTLRSGGGSVTKKVYVYNATSMQSISEKEFTEVGAEIRGLATDAARNCLYLSDETNGQVLRVSLPVSTTSSSTVLATPGNSVQKLSVTSTGNILVAANANGVQEYKPDGTKITDLAMSGVYQAVEARNGVWAVTVDSSCKLIFANGTEIASFGQGGSGLTTSFSPLQSLAIGARGYILVADKNNNRIVVLNPSLTAARELPIPASAAVTKPRSISFDASRGRLYIGERNKIQMFDNVTNINALFYT